MANKSKTRFNGIDLLLIIILIGALAGIIMRYQLVDVIKNSDGEQSAELSFYLSDIKETSENCFAEGDVFYITNSGECIGTLQSGFIFEPAEVFNETIDGRYVKSHSAAGRSDMRGVFLASGNFTNEGFLLGGTKYLAPGSKLSVRSGKIEVSIILTDINMVS